MEQEIREFIEYLHNTKKTSQNTEVSYQRDLNKMAAYLEMKGIMKAEDVREFDLMDTWIIWRKRTSRHPLFQEVLLPCVLFFNTCLHLGRWKRTPQII